jgi:hypothetical protein
MAAPAPAGGRADTEEMIMSSWETTELPVLRAIRDLTRQRAPITVGRIEQRSGLGADEVRESLRRLAESHPPYVTGTSLLVGDGVVGTDATVTGLTPRAEDALNRDADPRVAPPHSAPGAV